jgi:uncharacterized Fe-S cluster protein YjdI
VDATVSLARCEDDAMSDERVEQRKQRNVARTYATDRIEVRWEPRLCVHIGECFQGLPDVFDPWSRPWVRPGAAGPDEIAEVVMRCPTGALHFRRLDDGPQEDELAGDVELAALPDGPMQVRGKIRLTDGAGRVLREDTRLALCRCGASRNKPFCDGTHKVIGFRDP